jgi:hypothetical protein
MHSFTMIEVMYPPFALLVSEHGFEPRFRIGDGPYQFDERIARRHSYGKITVDAVTFAFGRDRGDILQRSATLIGKGSNRIYAMDDLLLALGVEPTGTGDDFITAATLLDTATIERLAPQ